MSCMKFSDYFRRSFKFKIGPPENGQRNETKMKIPSKWNMEEIAFWNETQLKDFIEVKHGRKRLSKEASYVSLLKILFFSVSLQ